MGAHLQDWVKIWFLYSTLGINPVYVVCNHSVVTRRYVFCTFYNYLFIHPENWKNYLNSPTAFWPPDEPEKIADQQSEHEVKRTNKMLGEDRYGGCRYQRKISFPKEKPEEKTRM
jgi:hypothetical protein